MYISFTKDIEDITASPDNLQTVVRESRKMINADSNIYDLSMAASTSLI